MMKFHHRISIVMMLSIAIIYAGVAAASVNTPRAWLVKKGDSQAVLVGESHTGTPAENDRYLKTVIEPSHAVAEVAIMEGYFGIDQVRNEAFEVGAPCFDQTKPAPTARVESAFASLTRAVQANHLEVPNWLEGWRVVPDFHFISIFLDGFAINTLGTNYNAAIEAQGGAGISVRLRATTSASKKMMGLDTLKDRRDHFCSASVDQRADFLADSTMRVSRLLWLKNSDPDYASMGQLARLAGQLTDATVGCVDRLLPCKFGQISPVEERFLQEKGWVFPYSEGTFRILIKERNHAWLPRITKTIREHRRSFIIVGALHLPDLRVGSRVEPGLISLLRHQGFSVSAIRAESDISATFLSPSWFDRMRAILSSL